MHKVTKAILILTLSYIALIAYAFGVFLQQPLISGEILTWQATVEPLFYIAVMIIGHYFIFKTVYFQEKKAKLFFDEKKLLVPTIVLLMLISLGTGVHLTGQLIEETFVNSATTTQHFTNNFSSQVTYFLEEYPGHLLIIIPALFLSYFLAKLELNRKKPSLQLYETVLILGSAIFSGTISAISNAESHSTVLVVPISIYLLFKLYNSNTSLKRKFLTMPYTSYLVVNILIMIILNIIFGISYGWFTQPTELGFGSITRR